MPNPATYQDVESRWRPLSEAEQVNANTFLNDAWLMLKRAVEGIETRMVADLDLSAEVVRIISTAVLRVMKNPDGKRQESIDDYAWTRDEAQASGVLYFTDDELASLIPGAAIKGQAFSVNMLGDYAARLAE